MSGAEDRELIRELIAQTGRLIDAREFGAYVACYTESAHYLLEADSAELGQRMTWLDMPRDELQALLEESPDHVHDLAERLHQITLDEIALDEETAKALSTFSVFRTDPAGVTEVYAVGQYEDELVKENDGWVIKTRRVLVKTRMFRTPTPMPL